MKKLMLSVAALAAASPIIAQAQAQTVISMPSPVHDRTHIRTTLHGAKGPLVVLIPGMSTPGAVWDDTVTAMKSTHRLLVVDVRGFDGQQHPANAKAGLLDGIVADLSAELRDRRLGGATIVGHSMGGLLAMKFGLAHPDQAKAILVIDALPFFGTVFDEKATLDSVKSRAAQMRDMMIAGAPKMRAAAEKMRAEAPIDCGKGMVLDPQGACKVQRWSMSADPEVVAQAVYEDILTDLRRDIAGLKMPLTVLYQAAIDPDAAKARYETDYSSLPSARLVPVDRTSHFIMIDRPALVQAELKAMTAR